MAEPWWRAGAQDLHRMEDRISSLYVERCHVDRDENAVVLVNRERTVRVPAAYLAVVLLGPGTRITHAAVTLLGDSGTALCWVGEKGVRLYASGLGTSRGSQLVMRQAHLVTRPQERLGVARRMYAMRFPGEDTEGLTMQQLRGREGVRVRRAYQQHAKRTGVPWTKRDYRPGEPFAAGDDVNRLLSAANSALYGICHAVITGIGASPALGFVHTGSAVSFVLDIADLYKADYTIPLAFDLTADGRTSERDARLALRDAVTQTKLLPRIVSDIAELLMPDATELVDRDVNALWDDSGTTVSGGTNWGADIFDAANYLAVVGPDFDAPITGDASGSGAAR
ncbi:type I-E CRISPR-associated endonuclease Cas1 [Streptomyces sp. 8K308]|uniref:type I-E CRISPR-associated endonuclease Cas1e n=1 Tax=Streptomyces sp. 8K308 TaxID=2530388 RepID=UPI001051277C|nr:type I-E CRISPR-associated endonuclease Cas1e [Streptomyces sp. 8K308]TDC19417.1 type I-E CRISPR-associated endonuclease Cas1 [Streptomyces sp. 8K308]